MRYDKWIILFLSFQCLFLSYKWLQSEKKISFLEGQMSVCNAAVDIAVETGENPYEKTKNGKY